MLSNDKKKFPSFQQVYLPLVGEVSIKIVHFWLEQIFFQQIEVKLVHFDIFDEGISNFLVWGVLGAP